MLCNKQPRISVVYSNKHVFLRSVDQWWFCWIQLGLPMFDLTHAFQFQSTPGSSLFWDQLLHILLMVMKSYASKPILAGTFNIFVGVTFVIISLVKLSHMAKTKVKVAGIICYLLHWEEMKIHVERDIDNNFIARRK